MGSDGECQEAFMKLMEVATLYSVPMALKAAIQLKVMDILAEHGGQDHFLSPSQIVSHFECPLASTTSPEQASSSLDRILRVLASHGLLASSLHYSTPQGEPIRTYGLNSTSTWLVQNDAQDSFAAAVVFLQDPITKQCFDNLHEAVLDDVVPFTKVHGMSLFSYTQVDARFSQLFNNSMATHSMLLMHSLLQMYNGFEEITSLVDVGGGIGACLGMITSKHPHIHGINFDQPHVIVIAVAPEYPGVKHVGGDMFMTIPKADAIFMKWILHDWSDAHCLKILENCYEALPNKGKVIVVDTILPTQVECGLGSRLSYQVDLFMFAHTGGKERTKRELENISKASGFSKLQVICKIREFSVTEIYK